MSDAFNYEWRATIDSIMQEALERQYRRALAERILLKLIEIAPTGFDSDVVSSGEGAKLAWSIADAFLKHEGGNTP